jgi:hypothetical protein
MVVGERDPALILDGKEGHGCPSSASGPVAVCGGFGALPSSSPVAPAAYSVQPLPLTQPEDQAEPGVAPNQLVVLGEARRCVAHSGSGGASAVRATCCRTVSSGVRREQRTWLNHADLVGPGRVVSAVLMALQAGGHRFDPGTLH